MRILLISVILFCSFFTANAQSVVDQIQSRIDQKNADIKNLEKDIALYQSEITALSAEGASLTDTIKALTLTEKKLRADISVTGDKIDNANLRIEQTASDIVKTQGNINNDTRFVVAAFKSINEQGDRSPARVLLSSQSFGDAWDDILRLAILQDNLQTHIAALQQAKSDLESKKRAVEANKAELVTLQKQLKGQQSAVLAAEAEKNALLKQTKSSESSYRALLADKQRLKDAFEKELFQFESELKLAVNKSLLPPVGTSVLSWPMDETLITQFFGNTPFATANPQVYKGTGHNGIDLRATIGTPIKASLSGTVVGVANTDIVPGCYSFGRWVMIRHPAGLSTLYSHLSIPSVTIGDVVTTGQIIGYSGNTGYTTGPHLHFGVYASDGVEIKKFTSKDSKNCAGATIPVAVLAAYLNPLSYLPAISR